MPDRPSTTVGVRFPNAGRISYFDSAGMRLEMGEYVVVMTTRGPELGHVVIAPDEVLVDKINGDDLPPVLRPAGAGDIQRAAELNERGKQTLIAARALAKELDFPATIQKTEYTLDGRRLTIHFESPERVDYREFARRASREFDCRIDMHNLGPRDRARLAGGYGICGRELCCANWLQTFPSISIRMAKEQDKPLNPEKISGLCGRLLCCLSYEEEGYKEMRRTLPKLGHRVSTPTGEGRVVAVNILRRAITINVDGQRIEVPDRDLGTVVRWDPGGKANEPPPSMSRAEGVSQGMVEADELDADPAAAEWPPRTSRFGRLPATHATPAPPPRPRDQRPAESDTPQERRSTRRRRRDGAETPAREQRGGRPPNRRQSPPGGQPEGRSRVFRRQNTPGGPEGTGPSGAPGAGPADDAAGAGDGGTRRRGRRGGRRRGGGNSSGGNAEST